MASHAHSAALAKKWKELSAKQQEMFGTKDYFKSIKNSAFDLDSDGLADHRYYKKWSELNDKQKGKSGSKDQHSAAREYYGLKGIGGGYDAYMSSLGPTGGSSGGSSGGGSSDNKYSFGPAFEEIQNSPFVGPINTGGLGEEEFKNITFEEMTPDQQIKVGGESGFNDAQAQFQGYSTHDQSQGISHEGMPVYNTSTTLVNIQAPEQKKEFTTPKLTGQSDSKFKHAAAVANMFKMSGFGKRVPSTGDYDLNLLGK